MSRLACLAAMAVALAGAAPAAAFDAQPMNELLIGSSQRSLAATAGPGCISTNDSHTCSGTAQPQPLAGTLFIRPAHQIALDFDWPVTHIHVGAPDYQPPCANCVRSQPASLLELTPVGGAPARRWLGSVPAGLPRGFFRWSIYVNYDSAARPTGNRNFEAGVYVLRSRRSRVVVPRLVGMPYATAIRELERRGLRWRRNLGPLQFDTGAPPAPGEAGNAPGGRVTAQSLRPGRRVHPGGTVRLTVEA